jgi:hypothetical protein
MATPTSASISAGLTGSPANFNSIRYKVNMASNTVATDTNHIAPPLGTMYTFTPSYTANFEWTPGTFLGSTTVPDPQVYDAYVTTTYTATASYAGCSSTGNVTLYVKPPVFRELDLKVVIEGLFNPATGLMREARGLSGAEFPGIADKITVELHKASTPFGAVDSLIFPDVDMAPNGLVSIPTLPGQTNGFYYIVVKHRNSIETWSADPVDFTVPIPFTDYDFTAGISQAYASNMKLSGGISVLWGADENQDGIIDASDMAAIDNASVAGLLGYHPEDVNGDGIVDASDMALIDNNSTLSVRSWKP